MLGLSFVSPLSRCSCGVGQAWDSRLSISLWVWETLYDCLSGVMFGSTCFRWHPRSGCCHCSRTFFIVLGGRYSRYKILIRTSSTGQLGWLNFFIGFCRCWCGRLERKSRVIPVEHVQHRFCTYLAVIFVWYA